MGPTDAVHHPDGVVRVTPESDCRARRQVAAPGRAAAVGEALRAGVPGCGRAPAQGRGLFHNRHIAHPAPCLSYCRRTLHPAPHPHSASAVSDPGAWRMPAPNAALLGGPVRFAPGHGDLCRQPQGVGPPVLGPARTRPSAGMLDAQPCLGPSLQSIRSRAPSSLQGPSLLPSLSP